MKNCICHALRCHSHLIGRDSRHLLPLIAAVPFLSWLHARAGARLFLSIMRVYPAITSLSTCVRPCLSPTHLLCLLPGLPTRSSPPTTSFACAFLDCFPGADPLACSRTPRCLIPVGASATSDCFPGLDPSACPRFLHCLFPVGASASSAALAGCGPRFRTCAQTVRLTLPPVCLLFLNFSCGRVSAPSACSAARSGAELRIPRDFIEFTHLLTTASPELPLLSGRRYCSIPIKASYKLSLLVCVLRLGPTANRYRRSCMRQLKAAEP